jgi:hypothetical protein
MNFFFVMQRYENMNAINRLSQSFLKFGARKVCLLLKITLIVHSL